MEFASVATFSSNEASRGLYRACGFDPWHRLDDYEKPISSA
jgi:RimJ/RimL family protein N-acetyltransferase